MQLKNLIALRNRGKIEFPVDFRKPLLIGFQRIRKSVRNFQPVTGKNLFVVVHTHIYFPKQKRENTVSTISSATVLPVISPSAFHAV